MTTKKKKKSPGSSSTKEKAPRKKRSKPSKDSRSRVLRIKEAQHQSLRDKLKGDAYIKNLEKIGKQYDEVIKALSLAQNKKLKLTSKKDRDKLIACRAQIAILRTQMDALRIRADHDFRRLKFVLPELKSIDLTSGGGNPFDSFAAALREAVDGPGL